MNIIELIKKLVYIALLIAIGAFSSPDSFAVENYVSSRLFESVRAENYYEIGEVHFVGNAHFESSDLLSLISSKPTSRSIPHKILQAYYYESKRNRAAPRVLVREFNTAIKSLEHELKFYNLTALENDTLSLWHFYNTQGFHKVSVHYNFVPDFEKKKNILTFYIDEGSRYYLDTVVYKGFEKLAPEVQSKVNGIISRRQTVDDFEIEQPTTGENKSFLGKKVRYFNEPALITEINMIHDELLNSGYYFAVYQKPFVSMDTINHRDSVTVSFTIGERIKIGEITFIDSTRGQHIVTRDMKRRQLDFKPNDWYSRKKVNNSIDNLLSIGTFESVSIDTSGNANSKDTILNFSVLSNYRKHREWGVALFTNHTQLTNYNAGLEGSISHRNLFGMAQTGSFFTSFSFKDIGRIIENIDNLDYEMQIGVRYAQPLLWSIDHSRVGATASASYTIRTINNFFQINTVMFPVKFPIKLPRQTYFNTMSVDFVFERENPVNFSSAVANALKGSTSTSDSLRVMEAFYLYNNLHQYLKEPSTHLLTSNTIGFSLVGDNKDHPFNPTKGTYTFIGFDGWNIFLSHPSISGIARFFRVQFLHSQYIPLTNYLVGAFKARFGAIRLMEDANVYVPIDKQFFAGGSNSVRGWQSRTLRYTTITRDSLGSKEAYEYMQNFIGSGGLIEGSIELRYKFFRPKGFSDFIAEQIGLLGITAFVDFGNAFHWYLGIDDIKLKVSDYFTKLAVAAGLGLRYETMLGPIRLDFATPLHDPLGKEKPFRKVQFHLGIGHAF